jgi:hypothetical protein
MASIRKKPGNHFEVRYWANGRQHSRTFPTERQARLFANAVETDKARGEWCDPRLGRQTFADFATEWARTMLERPDLAQNTKRNYIYLLEYLLLPFFGSKRMLVIERADVRTWVRWASTTYAAWPVHNAYGVLRLIFDEAVERRVVVSTMRQTWAASHQTGDDAALAYPADPACS